jgi:hypothetical protein
MFRVEKNDHVYFCHASYLCVLLNNENMHVYTSIIKYHLKVFNVLSKYNLVHDIFYTSNPQTN